MKHFILVTALGLLFKTSLFIKGLLTLGPVIFGGVVSEDYYPYNTHGGLQQGVNDPNVQASAATMPKPNAFLTVVSGAAAITLIPLPYPGFSGMIAYRATGAFTGATGGVATDTNKPVGLAWTAVVGKILLLVYDPSTALWYPVNQVTP